MRVIRDIFDDWLTRGAAIVLILIGVLTLVNTYSDLPNQVPVMGMFLFSMIPVLFIVGGVIFVLAILKSQDIGK